MHKIRNEQIIQIVGKNLRKIRTEKGFTQEQLAEESSVSQVQIARIESGKLNTSISTIAALGSALNVDIGMFFVS